MSHITVVNLPGTQITVLQPSVGLQGGAGPMGPGGIADPSGAGDLNYQHTQGPASATWLINHGLGKFPSITVIDSAGEQVEGEVVYLDSNSLQIIFSAAFAGKAFLN